MPWLRQADGSWMVRGYHEVIAALREPRLAPGPGDLRERAHYPSLDSGVALQRVTLRAWQALGPGEVELVSRMGRSFGATAAASVLGISEAEVRALSPLAEVVWRESAMATSSAVSSVARDATSALAAAFNDQATTHVQAFVALTHSLPALVSNVMVHSLTANPLWPTADDRSLPVGASRVLVDEWLRCCAPVRYVFRQVGQRLVVNGESIEPGTSVTVDIESANCDASVFPEPHRVLPEGRRNPHVAFGVAPHACRGAGTVQLALAAFLEAWWAFRETHRLTLLSTETEAGFVAMRAWQRVQLRVEVA
ncbi:MAG: cytochrome P450 [Gemmatimonadaceae bacterium]|nr:cytochrome P450 [Gemmatimonadaceae bacterium]